MTDLIERLRGEFPEEYVKDAAAEIERLKKALRLAAGELSTYGSHTTEHPEAVYNSLLEAAKEQAGD